MVECTFLSDREAKILTGILAVLILVPTLVMAHDVLVSPQTMVPVLIGVPLFAAVVWYGWGRTSRNWGAYAIFLAGAFALPVGALMYIFVGWIPVALGVKPIVVGAAFWSATALVALQQIVIMRKKQD